MSDVLSSVALTTHAVPPALELFEVTAISPRLSRVDAGSLPSVTVIENPPPNTFLLPVQVAVIFDLSFESFADVAVIRSQPLTPLVPFEPLFPAGP